MLTCSDWLMCESRGQSVAREDQMKPALRRCQVWIVCLLDASRKRVVLMARLSGLSGRAQSRLRTTLKSLGTSIRATATRSHTGMTRTAGRMFTLAATSCRTLTLSLAVVLGFVAVPFRVVWFVLPDEANRRFTLAATSCRTLTLSLAVVLGFVAVAFRVVWFVLPDEAKWPEPAFTVALLLIAALTGGGVFAKLKSLSARVAPPPLETSEDPTTRPWRTTNHSIDTIRWGMPEHDAEHQKTLHRFWIENYAPLPRGICPKFYPLLEVTSSINYRVTSFFKKDRFLRLHRAPKAGEIEGRQGLARLLREAGVFPDGYAKYVVPLQLKSGSYSSPVADSGFGPGRITGEVLPYARGVRHFPGRSVDEVASVARLLGRVQWTLQDLDKNDKTREELKTLLQLPLSSLPAHQDFTASWEYLQELANAERNASDQFGRLLRLRDGGEKSNWSRIVGWVKLAEDIRGSLVQGELLLLLHDVHPHNVFFKNDKCVLIYDYQWLGRYPHALVVAFSLHRFIRELAVNREASHADDLLAGAVSFLEAYQRHCDLPLPGDFESQIGHYVMAANIDQLVKSLVYGLTGHDELERTDARVLGEARKFIRYMKEAEELQSLLGSRPWVPTTALSNLGS